MTSLFTVLALVAMIGFCALVIQLANARHTARLATAEPRRRVLQRRGATARRAKHRP